MERKRKALSLETKYEIINEFEKSGKSKIEIAKHYDIPKSTLSGILNKKEKIIEEFHLSTSSPQRKRQRSGKQEDVDEALFQWFQAARQSNIPLNGIILQKKADDLALKHPGLFSSPEHEVLMVSFCGQWLSIVRRCPSCVVRRASTFDVYTLETTFVT